MKRKTYYPFLIFGLFLLGIFHFPDNWICNFRSSACLLSSFFWNRNEKIALPDSEIKLENILLKKQNENLRKRLLLDERIDHQLKKLSTLEKLKNNNKDLELFFKRRRNATQTQLNMELFSVYAKVIYREPGSWNSTLWIDVGTRENEVLDKTVVAVNSPVLKGPHLIGVIEYVGKSKSRVRLLTDSNLIPSVRVSRGGSENRELINLINLLLQQISLRDEDQEVFVVLAKLKQRLEKSADERYLAKGELLGTSLPIWRGCSHLLKGVGFNYDFADEEGPLLELRTGKSFDQLKTQKSFELIKKGDLLVTTGMDGIFPSDLPVANVSTLFPLKEGAVSFEIEAKMCAGNLNTLTSVVVLPPLLLLEEES